VVTLSLRMRAGDICVNEIDVGSIADEVVVEKGSGGDRMTSVKEGSHLAFDVDRAKG
jgi:hypothetical protein